MAPELRATRCVEWVDLGLLPSLCYLLIGVVCLGSAYIGWRLSNPEHEDSFLSGFSRFDGGHYQHILTAGYTYTPGERSELAFFPLYPIVAREIAIATGMRPMIALLATSNTLLAGAFVLLAVYLRVRRTPGSQRGAPHSGPVPRGEEDVERFALLAFAVAPCVFFFRLAYSEACFLFVALLCLLAFERRWPLPVAATLVGLCTATRPVGVALVLPFLYYIVRHSRNRRDFLWRSVYLVPLACWGLLAYMAFQWFEFRDPLIFASTQDHWHIRPPVSLAEKIAAYASWEPVWSVYTPRVPGYWRNIDAVTPILNMQFMNPVYFMGTAALVAIGAWKRWLTIYEVLVSVPLLAIPYLTKGYDNAMFSHARFALVVFPSYIVVGHLLAKVPRWAAWMILALSAVLMGVYAGEWAAGKPFF
jgi:hypothetical protein